jgi:hypothetical protein
MSDKQKNSKQAMIRFGNKDIPTYAAWKKLEAAGVAATRLEQLNARYPQLASGYSRDMVEKTRRRLKSVEVTMPAAPRLPPKMEDVVSGMIGSNSVEEVLEALKREHGVELDAMALVHVIGLDAYTEMLKREAAEFRQNFLSDEQIAELWNGAHMPAPGGGRWSIKVVEGFLKE